MRVTERRDGYQRQHRWAGFAVAVICTFFEDQGPYLAALITFYGFLSRFPLLLLLTYALGFVLEDNSDLEQRILDSTLSHRPPLPSQRRTYRANRATSGVQAGQMRERSPL